MPNIYIENRSRWEQLSEVDFLSAFANAWLAFNAWYRNSYSESQDRKIINEIKHQPNVVRNRILPLISAPSEEGTVLRSIIGQLHDRIENYHLHCGKGLEKERLTLTNAFIKNNNPTIQRILISGMMYEVIPRGLGNPNSQIESIVTDRAGRIKFRLVQPSFEIANLESNTDFLNNLNQNQRGQLMALYRNVNPRVILNLLVGEKTPILCGAYQFRCLAEELFAGMVEVVYLMRCSLFHGELVPCREATSCYEPAYNFVRAMLRAID